MRFAKWGTSRLSPDPFRKEHEERGTQLCCDTNDIKSPGHPPRKNGLPTEKNCDSELYCTADPNGFGRKVPSVA
jgi:hypothetical protein